MDILRDCVKLHHLIIQFLFLSPFLPDEGLDPADVLLDILLALLSRSSALLRGVAERVFRAFADRLTANGVQMLLNAIQEDDDEKKMRRRRPGEGQNGDDDHEDDGIGMDDDDEDEEDDEEDDDLIVDDDDMEVDEKVWTG
jgi:DNA polymerase phi